MSEFNDNNGENRLNNADRNRVPAQGSDKPKVAVNSVPPPLGVSHSSADRGVHPPDQTVAPSQPIPRSSALVGKHAQPSGQALTQPRPAPPSKPLSSQPPFVGQSIQPSGPAGVSPRPVSPQPSFTGQTSQPPGQTRVLSQSASPQPALTGRGVHPSGQTQISPRPVSSHSGSISASVGQVVRPLSQPPASPKPAPQYPGTPPLANQGIHPSAQTSALPQSAAERTSASISQNSPGISPYAGAAAAIPGSAVSQAGLVSPTSLYAGAAVAAPGITTAISDEEKKRIEKQERTQRYSELTFFEKVSFSGALVWGYRTNFIFGVIAVVAFQWCLQHLIEKNFSANLDNIWGLPVLFLSSFASLFVGVGFAALISDIADHGDPDSTTDLLFTPVNRFLKIYPAVAVWAVIYSAINLFIYSMGKSPSFAGMVVNMLIISCVVPLTMCVLYYIANNEEFTLAEGITGPVQIFFSNITGWLLFIPVILFTVIATALAIMFVLMIPAFGFVMIGVIVILCLSIVMLSVSYIFTYGCYVFKETAAKLELAADDLE